MSFQLSHLFDIYWIGVFVAGWLTLICYLFSPESFKGGALWAMIVALVLWPITFPIMTIFYKVLRNVNE